MTTHAANPVDAATYAAVDAFLRRLAPRYPMREAILFGSRSRGEARSDSDADLAVVLVGARAPFMETKLQMADIAFDAMLESGIRVQPLPIWDEDLREPDRWANPALLRNIERRGIRVWPAPTL